MGCRLFAFPVLILQQPSAKGKSKSGLSPAFLYSSAQIRRNKSVKILSCRAAAKLLCLYHLCYLYFCYLVTTNPCNRHFLLRFSLIFLLFSKSSGNTVAKAEETLSAQLALTMAVVPYRFGVPRDFPQQIYLVAICVG